MSKLANSLFVVSVVVMIAVVVYSSSSESYSNRNCDCNQRISQEVVDSRHNYCALYHPDFGGEVTHNNCGTPLTYAEQVANYWACKCMEGPGLHETCARGSCGRNNLGFVNGSYTFGYTGEGKVDTSGFMDRCQVGDQQYGCDRR